MSAEFAVLTKREDQACERIVAAAIKELPEIDRLDLTMDLHAVHATCPIDFERLESWSTSKDDQALFSFFHDIRGIIACLDRNKGKLRNNFIPRCAYNIWPAEYDELNVGDVVETQPTNPDSTEIILGVVEHIKPRRASYPIVIAVSETRQIERHPSECVRICRLDDGSDE